MGAYGGIGAFERPLEAMLQRARHILRRGSALGRARRISGKGKMGKEELLARLERLRQHVKALATEAKHLIPDRRRSQDERALWNHLKALWRAVAPGRYATQHEATIRDRLATLRHEAADAAELIEAMAVAAARKIDPDARLDLLTPEELAETHDAPAVSRLGLLLRLGDALRAAGAEASHLLIGMPIPQVAPAPAALDTDAARARGIAALLALDPSARPDLLTEADIDMALGMAALPPPTVQAPGPGPHERRRGQWLAVHLMGLAVGLGESATRSQGSSPMSAADLISDVRNALLEEVTEPSELAVLSELPGDFEGARHLWRAALSDPALRDAANFGAALGDRLRSRNFPVERTFLRPR